MKHFDITQWTDYVRGLAPPGEREAMEHHLTEGCSHCAQLVAMLERVRQLAAREPTVPERLVRAAEAILPAAQPALPALDWTLLPRMGALLVYCSLNEPMAEGARSSMETLVQAVYHTGDYAIDLQIEPDADSAAMAVVGQMVNRKGSAEPLAGVPVRLMGNKTLLAAAQSNCFGEFCLVSKFRHGLRLCMPFEALGRRVEIPLDRILAGLRL